MNVSEISPEAIISLSSIASTAKVTQAAGTMMLAKSLDNARSSGAAITDMMRASMERSVNPSVGSHFDASV